MRTSSRDVDAQNELAAVHALYADYMEVLDDERIQEWPGFFTPDCVYQIIPRENYENNSGLCLVQAEGIGMLEDRVLGILKTQKYGPQRCRRFVSGLKISRTSDGVIYTRQNVLVVQSLMDSPSSILLCGAAYDQLCWHDSRLLLKQRTVVCDTEIIDNALIFPV